MNYSLGTVLSAVEADTLAQSIAFIRVPTSSGRGWMAEFLNEEDQQRGVELLQRLRSPRRLGVLSASR